MINKQLSRLRDLKKEIKMYQERLVELQSLSEVKSSVLTGMPVSKSVSDKIGYSVIKIINTKNTLTKLCEEITEYIENVDFEFKNNRFRRLKGSSMPFFPEEDIFPDVFSKCN